MRIASLRPSGVSSEDFLSHLADFDAISGTALALAQYIESHGEFTGIKVIKDRFPEWGFNKIKVALFDLASLGYISVTGE